MEKNIKEGITMLSSHYSEGDQIDISAIRKFPRKTEQDFRAIPLGSTWIEHSKHLSGYTCFIKTFRLN